MKNELHTKYYLPWQYAQTHIHLRYTKQNNQPPILLSTETSDILISLLNNRVILMWKAKLIYYC